MAAPRQAKGKHTSSNKNNNLLCKSTQYIHIRIHTGEVCHIKKGYLRCRITVTLQVFNFRTLFLAQNVENRDENQIRSFRKLSPGPKNGPEIRPSQFSTICAKNQVLKLNISKVTVTLDTQTLPGAADPLYMYTKFSRY
jgi:hypothetical protein